nr:MAG TPA: tail tape measure protein [Caudoviricetes sp.]
MADVDITSLSVEISAESSGAELNIDKLATAISNLRTKGNVAKVCSSLDKLSASISALKSASTGLDGLSKITSFMNGLANVDLTQSAKGIRSVANALNKISSVNLGNMDFSGLGSKMNSLKNGLSPISSISDSSIKSLRGVSSAINSIAKIPNITKKLDSKTLDDFAEVCKKVASAISPLASKLDKVGRSFSSLPSKIKSAVNSTTRFSSANQKASTSLSSLASQLETIKKRAAQLVSLKAIATYLANAVTKFNDFYEATDLFNNAMGELSGQATELINKMESLLGIDPTEAMTNIATIQSLATSFGLASDKAYILSKNLTQLAYDESSYWNKDTATTFTAIASAISGELEPIRRLGVDLSQARLQQELLALGFNKQVSSLSQADKAVLRYIAIMKQTTNIQGNLAQTISSPANMVRILKSEISQLAKAVGQLLYPAFKAILPVLIAAVDLIKEFVVSLASVFGQKIEFTDFSKTQKDIGGVSDAMDDAADATKAAAKAAKDYTMGFDELNIIDPSQNSGSSGSGGGDATGNLLGDVDLSQYDMFKDYAGSAVDEIKAKLKSLDSFQIGTQIGEQLNKLMGMIYDAIHSVDWVSLGTVFADGVNGLVDSVDWDLFGRLLADRFIIEFELLGGFLSRLDWTSVLNAFIDGFSGFFHELSDWIATVDWTGVGKQLTDKLSDAFQNVEIEKLARVLFNFITDSINAVADFLAGTDSYQLGQDLVDFAIRAVTSVDWAGLAQAIGRFFGEAFIEALDFMGGLVSRIADYFEKKVAEGPFDNVGLNIVYGIYYGIQDAITNVASWIVENVFNPFINGFKSAFGINSPSTVMAEQGGYIIAGLKKGITDAISSVTETAKKILSAIKSAFDNFSLFDIGKNLIQGLIDGVNNMIETAKNAVANVGNAVIDKVKNVLGIHSPSTVFAEIGGYIDQGLANGIAAAVPCVTAAMQSVVNAVQEKGQALIDAGSTQATNYVTGFLNGLDTQWQQIDQSLQSDFFGSIGTLWDAISNGDLEKLGTWAASYFYHAMDDEQRKQIKSIANNSLQWLTQGLSSVWNNIAGMASSFISQFVPSAMAATSAQTSLNIAMDANPVMLVISLIGMLVGALVNFANKNKSIASFLSNLWYGIGDFFSIVFEGILRVLGTAIQGIVAGINALIDARNFFNPFDKWGHISNPLYDWADNVASSRAESQRKRQEAANSDFDDSKDPTNYEQQYKELQEKYKNGSYPGTKEWDKNNGTSSGSYGSTTSVNVNINEEEMRESVYNGTYNAFLDIFQRYGDELTGGKELKIYLDGKQITASVEKRQNARGQSLMGSEVYSY